MLLPPFRAKPRNLLAYILSLPKIATSRFPFAVTTPPEHPAGAEGYCVISVFIHFDYPPPPVEVALSVNSFSHQFFKICLQICGLLFTFDIRLDYC
jgi:hypothetical protein